MRYPHLFSLPRRNPKSSPEAVSPWRLDFESAILVGNSLWGSALGKLQAGSYKKSPHFSD